MDIDLTDDLIGEIFGFLSVKSVAQLKCLNKYWNTFLSNPTFIQNHLKKSSKNPKLTLMWIEGGSNFSLVPFPVTRLLENPPITVYKDTFHRLKSFNVACSCNGLICSIREFVPTLSFIRGIDCQYFFEFWNPSIRMMSGNLVEFRYNISYTDWSQFGIFKFTFGCDDATNTYKVVAYRVEGGDEKNKKSSGKSEVKVFNVGGNDNRWRNIQSFPVIPLDWSDFTSLNNGEHLSGTVNWLTIDKYLYSSYEHESIKNAKQFLIVSLDLSTETYKLLLLPQGFDEVPVIQPILRVMMDRLCFSHDFKKIEFVLWQMNEYGVQKSWTQLFKISYQNISIPITHFRLVCLYKNGDKVILANQHNQTLIYNLRGKTSEISKISNRILWFSRAKEYVESFVTVP